MAVASANATRAPRGNAVKHFDVVITSTKRQRVDLPKCPRIHSLAFRATNGQNLRTSRKFYYAAKSAGCLTLAFCVTSTKQRRTEPNVGGDRPRQPAVDGGSRTLGRAPRWGANVAWGSLPRVRCATLGYDVQPRCGCREGHCQILELGTWNLEPALGLTGKASARLLTEKNAARRANFLRS